MAADGTPYLANLLPLSGRRASEIDASATAAVFVQKAAVELPNPPEVVANAYKLTKTELRNLFRKAGTKHQTDLVKLVAGFSRPVIV